MLPALEARAASFVPNPPTDPCNLGEELLTLRDRLRFSIEPLDLRRQYEEGFPAFRTEGAPRAGTVFDLQIGGAGGEPSKKVFVFPTGSAKDHDFRLVFRAKDLADARAFTSSLFDPTVQRVTEDADSAARALEEYGARFEEDLSSGAHKIDRAFGLFDVTAHPGRPPASLGTGPAPALPASDGDLWIEVSFHHDPKPEVVQGLAYSLVQDHALSHSGRRFRSFDPEPVLEIEAKASKARVPLKNKVLADRPYVPVILKHWEDGSYSNAVALVGASGSGKSRVVERIFEGWKANRPDRTVIRLDAREIANEVVMVREIKAQLPADVLKRVERKQGLKALLKEIDRINRDQGQRLALFVDNAGELMDTPALHEAFYSGGSATPRVVLYTGADSPTILQSVEDPALWKRGKPPVRYVDAATDPQGAPVLIEVRPWNEELRPSQGG